MTVMVKDQVMTEVGCYIDGSHSSVTDLNMRTAMLADQLLGGNKFATEAAGYVAKLAADEMADDDTADAAQALNEVADEAIEALNEATEGGYWEVDESSVFVRDADEDDD